MNEIGEDNKHDGAKQWIRDWCRRLKPDHINWDAASDPIPTMNCMGHAVGVPQWWQQRIYDEGIWLNPEVSWPESKPEDDSITAFVEAAKTQRFVICDGPEIENGWEKIVLYYDKAHSDQPFWHAARVISGDMWESKLAQHSDIHHDPKALDDVMLWGSGRVFMKREIQS